MEKDRRLADLELESKEKVYQIESDAAEKAQLVAERHHEEKSKLEAENRVLLGKLATLEASSTREVTVPLVLAIGSQHKINL
eukprot:scaffold185323_cov49-Prasinocladus_malaysianus.AAC.2